MLKIEATGCIGRDADVREFGGIKKITYTLGVQQRNKAANGEIYESIQWVSCLQTYHEGSELPSRLRKGTRVFVRGGLRLNIYNDRNGNQRIGVSCDVDQMEIQSMSSESEDDYISSNCLYR